MGAERRDGPRRHAGETGTIMLHGRTRIECRVMDTSMRGARLRFHTPVVLPKRFELRFDRGGQTSQATVMWQSGLLAGVRLATAPPEPMRTKKPARGVLRLFGAS